MLKKLYISLLVFVYALYCYFNKGVAYTYLAEASWLIGMLLCLRYFRQIEFAKDKRAIGLIVLLGITALYTVRGLLGYPVIDVIRDSFMFNYGYFVFIIFVLRDEIPQFKEKLYIIYKWFPLVLTISFFLRNTFPSLLELEVFGRVPLLLYKNGDLGVHVLIATLFTLNGNIKMSMRHRVLNLVLLVYLFLVAATFNRGGMMAFVIGFSIYVFMLRKTPLGKQIIGYFKFMPAVLVVALALYVNTKSSGEEQGRNVGLDQLKNNVVSLVDQKSQLGSESGLNENVLWRLVWWGKIIDYTVFGPYFFQGKGVGINLAVSDDIEMEDDTLRSPHSFHLNILARFGVPVFLFWLWWMYCLFRPLKTKIKDDPDELLYICVIAACLVNSSFDVSLEGPMAALPFWIFIGLSLLGSPTPKTTPKPPTDHA